MVGYESMGDLDNILARLWTCHAYVVMCHSSSVCQACNKVCQTQAKLHRQVGAVSVGRNDKFGSAQLCKQKPNLTSINIVANDHCDSLEDVISLEPLPKLPSLELDFNNNEIHLVTSKSLFDDVMAMNE